MSMNSQGRPSQPGLAQDNELPTISATAAWIWKRS